MGPVTVTVDIYKGQVGVRKECEKRKGLNRGGINDALVAREKVRSRELEEKAMMS